MAELDHIRKEQDKCLGGGATGNVYLGFDATTGRLVAIKEIPDRPHSQLSHHGTEAAHVFSDAVRNEIDILRRCDHPNLVRYVGARAAVDPTAGPVVHIVMEYVSGGSLTALVRRFGRLEERVAAMYAADVLRGLRYLHDTMHVCHRDIKGENVLVAPEGHCKLTDYGASKAIHDDGQSILLHTCVGSPPYMAPEVAAGDAYGKPADVWSLGCTVFEMLAGGPPDYGMAHNPMAMLYRVASEDGLVPVLPEEVAATPALEHFLARCFQRDPAARSTAAELLSDPWLVGLEGSPTPSTPLPAASKLVREESVADSSAPRCQRCLKGIALYSCDLCRAAEVPHRLCPSCWDVAHADSRLRIHRKAPLLLSASHTDAGLLMADGKFVDMYTA